MMRQLRCLVACSLAAVLILASAAATGQGLSGARLQGSGAGPRPEADKPSPPHRPATDPTVVLNEQAYFRQLAVYGLERLSARPLKEEAERFFPADEGGKTRLARIKRNSRKLLQGRDIDWSKTDWRDVAVYAWPREGAGT